MKKIMVLSLAMVLVFGILCIAVAMAADDEKKFQIHGNLEFGFYSEYIGSVTGSTVFNKPVFQQSFELSVEPWGLYAKVWNSYSPKGGWNSDFGDEVDYVLGIRRKLGKGWDIDFGYAFYDMYQVGRIKGDLHALYSCVEFPKVYEIRPFVYLEWDIPTHREIVKGGVIYRGGLSYTLKALKQPIDLELSIAGHDDAYGYKAEFISSSRLSFSTPIKIWKLNLTPKINFQKRLGHSVENGGMTENKIWEGCALVIHFRELIKVKEKVDNLHFFYLFFFLILSI